MTALSQVRPFPPLIPFVDLKHDLWEQGVEVEYFHATEDNQSVRNSVFGILGNCLGHFRVDSIIVEKRKTNPTLQHDLGRFYQKVFDILMKYVLEGQRRAFNSMFMVTDTIPVKQRRLTIEKAIKHNLSTWAKEHGNSYTIQHYASKSELNLQAVDYLGWAIFRKWERSDLRSYNLIRCCVQSEFDVFEAGATMFY